MHDRKTSIDAEDDVRFSLSSMQPVTVPKTLFILGAGSSHSLGYPLGNQLKRELLAHLKPANTVFSALIKSGFQEADVTAFARQLHRAEFDTIDQHLREITDERMREIGKRAVAYLIRMKESEDILFHEGPKARHWYKIFADHLANFREHASPTQFSFISFNYDRSLPHYLYETLQYRNASTAKLKAFLGELNYYHVHGHVGGLPWHFETGGDSKAYYQYGASLSIEDLSSHLPRILLPHDTRDAGLIPARLAGDAEVVAFVGFGFHDANIERLPFSATMPVGGGGKRRRFVSINPVAPPRGILLDGQGIEHLEGSVDQVISKFFRILTSGNLRFEGGQPAQIDITGRLIPGKPES